MLSITSVSGVAIVDITAELPNAAVEVAVTAAVKPKEIVEVD